MPSREHGAGPGELHISDEELLLFVDGELSPDRRKRVRQALDSCWSCRSRCEKLQSAITDYAALRQKKDGVLVPPKGWREFPIRLEEVDRELTETGRSLDWLAASFLHRSRALAKFAVLVLVTAGLVLWVRSLNPPAVHATEFLQRAGSAESRGLLDVAEPWIYQKLNVVKRTPMPAEDKVGTIEVWSRASGEGMEHRGHDVLWEDVWRVLRANNLEIFPLLSAGAIDQWRSSIDPVREEVTEIRLANGTRGFALHVIAPDSAAEWRIRDGRLVVRADWSPVSLAWTVGFGGQTLTYELTRLDSKIVAADALPSFQLTLKEGAGKAVSASGSSTAAPGSERVAPPILASSPGELESIELQVQYALHRRGECVHGTIRVGRAGPGRLTVEGIVESAAQREGLLMALPSAPFLDVKVDSVEELENSADRPLTFDLPVGLLANRASATLPVEEPLREYFSQSASGEQIAEQITGFMDSSVRLGEAMRREAWALRRLAESYPPARSSLLSLHDRRSLESMIRDHANQLETLVDRGSALLQPFLVWMSARGQLNPLSVGDSSPEPGVWADQSVALTTTVEQVDDLLRGLFASSSPGSLPVAQAVTQLAGALQDADRASSSLADFVDSNFIADQSLTASGENQLE